MIDGFTSKNLFKDDKVRDSVEHDFGFSDVHLEEYAAKLESKSQSKAIQTATRQETKSQQEIDFIDGTQNIE